MGQRSGVPRICSPPSLCQWAQVQGLSPVLTDLLPPQASSTLSLCSSLSVSFNSSKHFHLYGSKASKAQVCTSEAKTRQQRGLGTLCAAHTEGEGSLAQSDLNLIQILVKREVPPH